MHWSRQVSSLNDRLKETRQRIVSAVRSEENLHAYQSETAVQFLLDKPFSALFIDTGLGKTIIVLTYLLRLFLRNELKKTLIIAPVRVAAQTWPNELGVWKHIAFFKMSVIRAEDDDPEVISAGKAAYDEAMASQEAEAHKSRVQQALLDLGDSEAGAESYARKAKRRFADRLAGKARTAKKEELRQTRRKDPALIHVINREQLTWLIDQHSTFVKTKRRGKIGRVRKVVDWPYKIVVIDESSSFKDPQTTRFKALGEVRRSGMIERLHQLTATPAAEGYMGMFAQMYLLDLGERLGKLITKYRDRYFTYNQYSRVYKLKEGAKEAISDAVADICLVMKSKDYLDEQEPLMLDRMIDLHPREMAMYRELERDFIVTIPPDENGEGGEEIEAETAASLSSKLLQLASGAIYNKDREVRVVHNHKIEDLAQLVEELQGSPILVAYWYKHSLTRLKKAFPKAHTMDAAGKRVHDWNAGKISMLLVHPASIGHGLNMQYGPGHDLYMFDQCWSWELFYQLYRRLARQGQKFQVRIHLPQVRGTNDTLVVERLREKEDAQEVLFRRIKAMWRRMREALQRRAS
jgi:hypothetical protein